MPLVSRRLRFLTPVLSAQIRDPKQNEKFRRRSFERVKTKEGERIAHPLSRWCWALREARDSLGLLHLDTRSISVERAWPDVKTSTYVRRFGSRASKDEEWFESFPANRVLAVRFNLSGDPPPSESLTDMASPTTDELDAMLSYVGEWLGMSHWGNELDFGRFELSQQQDANNNEIRAASLGDPAATGDKETPDDNSQGVGAETIGKR